MRDRVLAGVQRLELGLSSASELLGCRQALICSGPGLSEMSAQELMSLLGLPLPPHTLPSPAGKEEVPESSYRTLSGGS